MVAVLRAGFVVRNLLRERVDDRVPRQRLFERHLAVDPREARPGATAGTRPGCRPCRRPRTRASTSRPARRRRARLPARACWRRSRSRPWSWRRRARACARPRRDRSSTSAMPPQRSTTFSPRWYALNDAPISRPLAKFASNASRTPSKPGAVVPLLSVMGRVYQSLERGLAPPGLLRVVSYPARLRVSLTFRGDGRRTVSQSQEDDMKLQADRCGRPSSGRDRRSRPSGSRASAPTCRRRESPTTHGRLRTTADPSRDPGVTLWHDADGLARARDAQRAPRPRVLGCDPHDGQADRRARGAAREERLPQGRLRAGTRCAFRFNNYGGTDGFDFATQCAPYLAFGFATDGHVLCRPRTSRSVRRGRHPAHDPFVIAATA